MNTETTWGQVLSSFGLAVVAIWLLGISLPMATGLVVLLGALIILSGRSDPEHRFFKYVKLYFRVITMFVAGFAVTGLLTAIFGVNPIHIAAYYLQGSEAHGINAGNVEQYGFVQAVFMVFAFAIAYLMVYGTNTEEGNGIGNRIRRWAMIVAFIVALIALASEKAPAQAAPIKEVLRRVEAASTAKITAIGTSTVKLNKDVTVYVSKDGKTVGNGELNPSTEEAEELKQAFSQGSEIQLLNAMIYQDNVSFREVRVKNGSSFFGSKRYFAELSVLEDAARPVEPKAQKPVVTPAPKPAAPVTAPAATAIPNAELQKKFNELLNEKGWKTVAQGSISFESAGDFVKPDGEEEVLQIQPGQRIIYLATAPCKATGGWPLVANQVIKASVASAGAIVAHGTGEPGILLVAIQSPQD